MRPETEAFLERMRGVHDPTRADEQRVLHALRASLAAGAAGSAAAPASAPTARFGNMGTAFGSVGSKLNLLLICGAAALGAGDTPRAELSAVGRATGPGAESPVSAALPPAAPPVVSSRLPSMVAPASTRPPTAATEASLPALRGAPPPSPPRPARVASLRPELDLLREVRAALGRGDGAAALRALDAHATHDRVLLAERRAARILALCSLGRVDEARRAAVEFATAHPRSVQRDVIARSCAIP